MIVSGIAGVAVFLLIVSILVSWLAKKSSGSGPYIQLANDEAGKLMTEHTPTSLIFDNISYNVGKLPILKGITGLVNPGQVMAIMGPSGSGKTSLLDILANRTKSGTVSGDVYVNGHTLSASEYKKLIGYLDQEDMMIPTLTVYETILYSALLRLPRSMSTAAKKFRVMEVMQELGIDGIKDSKIGQADDRSISGGERRRVAIACELVTSPSILFLDEPTSGLDAYNAYNVVESLVTLARDYNRTIVFTIHQPRSNIVTLFDQLVLLSKGHAVYSGPQVRVQSYFKSIGYACPPGFNVADYLIDLTMQPTEPQQSIGMARDDTDDELSPLSSTLPPAPASNSLFGSSNGHYGDDLENTSEQWAAELGARQERLRRERIRKKRQQAMAPDVVIGGESSSSGTASPEGTTLHQRRLIEAYNKSVVAVAVKDDIERILAAAYVALSCIL